MAAERFFLAHRNVLFGARRVTAVLLHVGGGADAGQYVQLACVWVKRSKNRGDEQEPENRWEKLAEVQGGRALQSWSVDGNGDAKALDSPLSFFGVSCAEGAQKQGRERRCVARRRENNGRGMRDATDAGAFLHAPSMLSPWRAGK